MTGGDKYEDRHLKASALPALAVLAAVTAFVFRKVLFAGEVLYLRDVARYFVPLQSLMKRRLLAGEAPLWNPHAFGGMPLLGDLTTGALYPPSLLSLLLPSPQGVAVLVVLHHLLGACGMYLLLRRHGVVPAAAMAAGVGFTCSGYLLSMDNASFYLFGLCLGPWVLWALDRAAEKFVFGRVALLAAALSLVYLSGDVQGALLLGLLALAYAALLTGRPLRGVASLVLAGGLCAALVAFQMLPFLSLARDSVRWGGLEAEPAQLWSFHPLRTLELLFPYPFGAVPAGQSFWGHMLVNHANRVPWAHGVYLGAPLLVLALSGLPRGGRIAKFFVVVALASLGLSMGAHLPLYGWARELVPFWNGFRYPEKMTGLLTLSAAAAAGIGLNTIAVSRSRDGKDGSRLAGRLVLFLSALSALALLSLALREGQWLPVVETMLRRGGSGHVTAAGALAMLRGAAWWTSTSLACAAALIALRAKGVLSPPASAWLWLALVAVDLSAANGRIVATTDPALYTDPLPVVEAMGGLAAGEGPFRIFRAPLSFTDKGGFEGDLTERHVAWLRQSLAPNTGAEFGFDHADGYSAAQSGSFDDFWKALASAGDGRLFTLMGIRFVVDGISAPLFGGDDRFEEVRSFPSMDIRLLRFRGDAPRARLFYAWRTVPSAADALSLLSSEEFDPRRETVVEGRGTGGVSRREAGDVRLVRRRPEEVLVEADASEEGMLVISEAAARGWCAEVDGVSVPTLRADGLFLAAALPAGRHEVRFSYRPWGFAAGSAVSLCAVIFTGVGLASPLLRRRKRRLAIPPL